MYYSSQTISSPLCSLFLVGAVAFFVPSAHADVVSLAASKDNTLFESADGTLSNGAGQHFFAGRTNEGADSIRRGLLHFDVAGNVPAEATINSVTLELTMSRTISGSQAVSLHRVLGDWGEGTSNAGGQEGSGTPASAGDATWLHTFHDTGLWTNPGGDFEPTASASQFVAGTGSYTWGSTTQLISDVQSWLDNSPTNFGWLVVGQEGAGATAKRFNSRENPTVSTRPLLTISFTPGEPPVPGDATGDGKVNDLDAVALATNWGQVGGWSEGDFDGDGHVSPQDASILAAHWGHGVEAGEAVAVPEPNVMAGLLVLAGLACLRMSRELSGSG